MEIWNGVIKSSSQVFCCLTSINSARGWCFTCHRHQDEHSLVPKQPRTLPSDTISPVRFEDFIFNSDNISPFRFEDFKLGHCLVSKVFRVEDPPSRVERFTTATSTLTIHHSLALSAPPYLAEREGNGLVIFQNFTWIQGRIPASDWNHVPRPALRWCYQ